MTATSRRGRIRRALTLIEASMVLGILAIVTGGIVYGVDRLYMANKTASTIEEINAITLAMRDLHTGGADYSSMGSHTYRQVLPLRWRSGGGPVNYAPPFGEALILSNAPWGYEIRFVQVTEEACVALARGQYSRRVLALTFGNIDHSLQQGAPLDRATIERDCRRRPKTDFVWTAR